MRILLVLLASLCAYSTIDRMDGWTQSCQEGWRLHLIKRPHHTFTDKGLATPLPLMALVDPAASRSYIVGSKRSGVVGRVKGKIWRRRCTCSGVRGRRNRGVIRMGLGLIRLLTF